MASDPRAGPDRAGSVTTRMGGQNRLTSCASNDAGLKQARSRVDCKGLCAAVGDKHWKVHWKKQ